MWHYNPSAKEEIAVRGWLMTSVMNWHSWIGCVCGTVGVGGSSYYKYSTMKYGYLTGGAYGFSAGFGMTIVECLGILFLFSG